MTITEIVPFAAGWHFKQRKNSHLGPPVGFPDEPEFCAQFNIAWPVMPCAHRRRIIGQGRNEMELQIWNSSIVEFKMRGCAGPVASEF